MYRFAGVAKLDNVSMPNIELWGCFVQADVWTFLFVTLFCVEISGQVCFNACPYLPVMYKPASGNVYYATAFRQYQVLYKGNWN